MDTSARAAHPYLTEPVLYVVNPSSLLKEKYLHNAFRWYGKTIEVTRCKIPGGPRRHTWSIRFASVHNAEMALATRHGKPLPFVSPPLSLHLSHSLTSDEPPTTGRIYPQYLKARPEFFQKGITPQNVFSWFRTAGPLVSVHIDVDVGDEQRTIVIEYFEEEHANVALSKTNSLCKQLQKRPRFTLQTYDPCSIHCSCFGRSFLCKDLMEIFSRFGAISRYEALPCSQCSYVNSINSVSLNNNISVEAHGVVTFESSDCAAQALQEMNGKFFGTDKLAVRYRELAAKDMVRQAPSNTAPTADHDVPPAGPSLDARIAQLRREAMAQAARKVAERRAQAAAREAAEAKVKKRRERQLRREEADRINAYAKVALEAAELKRNEVDRELAQAYLVQEKVDQELMDAQKASAEAKRLLFEALDREASVTREAKIVQDNVTSTLRRKTEIDMAVQIAKEGEELSRTETDRLDRELAEEAVDEETIQQAELAESIRRMQELAEMEGSPQAAESSETSKTSGKEERARMESEHLAEERLKREREEAGQSQAEHDEKKKQDERKRREAIFRQRIYTRNVLAERERCRVRDRTFYSDTHGQMDWTSLGLRALQRFWLVSDEFDNIRFHDSQPLTFESVPWSILVSPGYMTFEDIEWGAVEKFFGVVERLMRRAEFRALVERAHRRFHPDEWRARGTLNSVWDQELRDQFEAAGNIVSQAITPLWLKTRQS